MKLLKPLVLAMGLSASIAAHAALWDFSYTFESGDVISGEFKGVKKGDFIEKIRDISMSFNGTPLEGSPFFDAFYPGSSPSQPGPLLPPLVSPTLSLNDFIIINVSQIGRPNFDPFNVFTILNNPNPPGPTLTAPFVGVGVRIGAPDSVGATDNPGSQDRWVLTRAHGDGGNHIPEPGTLALLALSLLMLPRASRQAKP